VIAETSILKITSSTYESVDLDMAIESYAKALTKALLKSKLLGKRPELNK
jgi:hypothetical protein